MPRSGWAPRSCPGRSAHAGTRRRSRGWTGRSSVRLRPARRGRAETPPVGRAGGRTRCAGRLPEARSPAQPGGPARPPRSAIAPHRAIGCRPGAGPVALPRRCSSGTRVLGGFGDCPSGGGMPPEGRPPAAGWSWLYRQLSSEVITALKPWSRPHSASLAAALSLPGAVRAWPRTVAELTAITVSSASGAASRSRSRSRRRSRSCCWPGEGGVDGRGRASPSVSAVTSVTTLPVLLQAPLEQRGHPYPVFDYPVLGYPVLGYTGKETG